ncbi:MAG TPA: hypothetical protein VGS16_13570 [Candidatus Dormibacteraeota bacterium]|nr:hypothetical protein [Candidatus Dormibacteraeota bacterium]
MKNPAGAVGLRPLILTVRLYALAHGCGEHPADFVVTGVLPALVAAAGNDELVERPPKSAQNEAKTITPTIPRPPINQWLGGYRSRDGATGNGCAAA